MITVAAGEIGTSESSGGQNKYINWYGGFGSGTPWCAIFVSWCANKSGTSKNNVPKFASCRSGRTWFQNKGRYKAKGTYTPKRNDIVFFLSNGSSHTGIVEYVSGNTLHTIEGNTSDKVARRTYSLSNAKISGYGVNYQEYNSTTSTKSTSTTGTTTTSTKRKKSNGEELAYLKKVLNTLESKKQVTIKEMDIQESYSKANVEIKLLVDNGKDKFFPSVLDGMKLTFERKGTPGKLTFSTVYDKNYKINEGNSVLLQVDSKKIFYGFVFGKKKSKDNTIEITCYNQLRYLKAKDTYMYSKKTTTALLKNIANDFNLNLGKLEDTKYQITRVEDNTELFSIIQNSLDETLMSTGEMYVLYDDVGKLRLRNVTNMMLNLVVDEDTAQDYTLNSSIDKNTYNQIKLAYENEDTGTLDIYIAKSSKNINKWGLLQYYDKVDSPDVAKLKAKTLLKLYNSKTKSLTISKAIGNTSVIAGSMVPVLLSDEGISVKNYMLVEKVVHDFSNRVHTMDLTLSGGGFTSGN